MLHNLDQRSLTRLRHVLRHVLDNSILGEGRLEVHVGEHGEQHDGHVVIDKMAISC